MSDLKCSNTKCRKLLGAAENEGYSIGAKRAKKYCRARCYFVHQEQLKQKRDGREEKRRKEVEKLL